MKKILFAAISSISLMLCSCSYFTYFLSPSEAESIGIIGGADGPTSIIVATPNGTETQDIISSDLSPVRLVRVDGALYYDTGSVSNTEARCGTLDGNLKSTGHEYDIPTDDNTANFDLDTDHFGYQRVTNITIEIPIGSDWMIFKKIPETYADNYKYCGILSGRMPNAQSDTSLIVLTNDLDIDFDSVTKSLYGSGMRDSIGKDYRIIFTNSHDEWGLLCYAENITSSGAVITFEQFGGAEGELITGEAYSLKVLKDGGWESVPTIIPEGEYAWHMIAYIINRNSINEFETNWEWLYGKLPAGTYRISKEVSLSAGAERKNKTYTAEFSITE